MVKSLTGLPANYAGRCEVVVNDKDSDIVARNAILLLTTLQFSPDEATPMMLHIWYSALVPAQTLRSLRDSILPLIQEVCKKIQTVDWLNAEHPRAPYPTMRHVGEHN